MSVLNRRWLDVLAVLLCFVFAGTWWMRSHEPIKPSARVDADRVEEVRIDAPTQSPLQSIAESAADTNDTASAESLGRLRGRVFDAASGQPVRDFQLKFDATHDLRPGIDRAQPQTFQSADGTFETQLPVGTWTILATASGYQRFQLASVQLTSAKAPEILVPLRRGHAVQGRVFDVRSGLGIGDARITSREAHLSRFEGSWRSRSFIQTQPDGTFVLDGVPAGPITLSINPDAHAPREVDIVVTDATPPVEIGLTSGGRIAGRLTEANGGAPISGSVSLFNLDERHGGSAPTRESGEFSYDHLPPGRYRLRGQTERTSASLEITLGENQKLEDIVLALGAGPSIRGTVTGLAPTELEQLNIHIEGLIVKADARGEFVLHGLAPGRVRVAADLPSRQLVHETVMMPANGETTVELHFPAGVMLSGRVTRGGKPLAGASVTPRPLRSEHHIYGTSTSSDGRYVLHDMPPGQYIIIAGEHNAYRRIEVSEDPLELNIDIPDSLIMGRVLEESGDVPIVDTEVTLRPILSDALKPQLGDRSNHYGRFELRGMDEGQYILNVYKPGYEMHREQITYGAALRNLTVRLSKAQGVQLKVRGARDGRAVPAITLNEISGGLDGMSMRIQLDEDGVGYLPSALAGSSLILWADGYVPFEVPLWDGDSLEIELAAQEQKAATE